MLIWGWGHRITKEFGEMNEVTICARCNNQIRRVILRDRTFFTLFFIPLIPYNTARLLVCPVCGDAQALTTQEFDTLTAGR